MSITQSQQFASLLIPNREIWFKVGHNNFFQGIIAPDGNLTLYNTTGAGRDRKRGLGYRTNGWDFLSRLSRENDGGVFYIPTQPEGAPLKECITTLDDIGIEIDGIAKADQIARYAEFEAISGIAPAATLTSGGKSIHAHWKLDRAYPVEIAQPLRRLVMIALRGDPAVTNLHQPMRYPGFYRREKQAQQALLSFKPDARYSPDQLVAGLKLWFSHLGWRLGSSAFDWAGHNWQWAGDKARGCCPWHQSQSGTAGWIADDGKGWQFHCGTCTDNRGLDAFAYWYALTQSRPGDYPKGKDYAIAAKEFLNLHGVTVPEWQPKKSKPHAVTARKPHLDIGNDEFSDHADQYPQTGIVALHGAKGSGKGKAIAQLLKGRQWLSVTALRSLARDQAKGWGGEYLSSLDRVNGRWLKNGHPLDVAGGSICIPSLLSVRDFQIDDFVIDELPAVQDFTLNSKLANKEGIRPALIDELERRIKNAKRVIVASADLDDESLKWIEAIRGEQAYLVRSDRQPLNFRANIYEKCTRTEFIAQYRKHIATAGKLTLLHCDSKKLAGDIAGLIAMDGGKAFVVTSDTSGDKLQAQFLGSKGASLPELRLMGYTAIVTSPSVKDGFSLEYHTNLIDSIWMLATGGSITATGIAQTLYRVRDNNIPRHVFVAERGRAYSKLSKEETITEFLRELKSDSRSIIDRVRVGLRAESVMKADSLEWDSHHFRLLAHLETQRNRDMADLRQRVIALLKSEGAIINAVKIGKVDALATKRDLKEIRERDTKARAAKIAAMPRINPEQADELSKRENLTQDERLTLEKYFLELFYKIDVDANLALWDKAGRRRAQIKNLERLINPELAIQATLDSIEKNPESPQDWSRADWQIHVLYASGAADLILEIWNEGGQADFQSQARIDPICDWLTRNKDQFRLAGFGSIEVSDRQLIATLLDWVGFDRTKKKQRVNGNPTWVYAIDLEHLEILKSIINRRVEATPESVPPPLTNPSYRGGWNTPTPPPDGMISVPITQADGSVKIVSMPIATAQAMGWHPQAA